MSKPQLPVLTHLQFLVLGVLRNEPQPGRTLRKALSALRHSPHRPGVLPADGAHREGPAGRRLVRADHGRRSGGDRTALPHHAPKARGGGTRRARSTSTSRAPPRNCGGPMPEFRRGLGRWLPREAERDLFHPSLEDLRARARDGHPAAARDRRALARLLARVAVHRFDSGRRLRRRVATPDHRKPSRFERSISPCSSRMSAARCACFAWSPDSPPPRC